MATPPPVDVRQLAATVTQLTAAVARLTANATAQATEIAVLRASVAPNVAALRLLTVNVAAQAAEIGALKNTVTALDREAGRSLLGGDAYNTTAFFVAFLVILYQLVADPTGDQDTTDLSELWVYCQWRTAAAWLLVYLVLVFAVGAQQLLAGWGGIDLLWLLALMLAPWAPLADKVWRTLGATWRVRGMMRSRGCRNRLTAIMREYLGVGNPHLAPIVVAYMYREVALVPRVRVPRSVVPDGVADWVLRDVRKQLVTVLDVVTDLERPDASVKARFTAAERRVRRVNKYDPLARLWSPSANIVPQALSSGLRRLCSRPAVAESVMLSPFACPPFNDATDPDQANTGREVHRLGGKHQQRTLSAWDETVLLDAMDEVLPGGTLSKSHVKELVGYGFCNRCVMACRAGVELFVESSNCAHEGVDTGAWFRDYHFQSFTSLDCPQLRTMRAAALVDNGATLVDDGRSGAADAEDEWTSSEASDQVLILLFYVARSLLGESVALEPWRKRITARYHSAAWWDSYWKAVCNLIRPHVAAGTKPPRTSSPIDMDPLLRSAVRDTAAGEVRGLLQALFVQDRRDGERAAGSPDSTASTLSRGLCTVEGCPMHPARVLLPVTRE